MSVHYKFKNSVDYDTITFDGVHISVGDLKKAIIQQRKLGKSDCDYKITDAETKVVYGTDDTLIPKNSSVIICRVPTFEKKKSNWNRGRETTSETATSSNDTSVHVSVSKITRASDRTKTTKGEDELIKDMIAESTEEYDSSHFARGDRRGLPGGPLPSNYVCYRCNQTGHHIKQCPTNNLEMKRSTGIPRSFMRPCDPTEKGAYMTPDGGYARPVVEAQAYSVVKVEKPPTMTPNDQKGSDEPTVIIPSDLTCSLCSSLLRDAVLISCCAEAACDDCIRNILIESDDHECPLCHTKDVPPDTLIPCIKLRKEVTQFLSETDPLRKVTMAKETPKPTVSSVNVAVISSKSNDSPTINSGDTNDKSNNTNSNNSDGADDKSNNTNSKNLGSPEDKLNNTSSNNFGSTDEKSNNLSSSDSGPIDDKNNTSAAPVLEPVTVITSKPNVSPTINSGDTNDKSNNTNSSNTDNSSSNTNNSSNNSNGNSSSSSNNHNSSSNKSVPRRAGHMGPPVPPPHMGPRGHNSESLLGMPPPPPPYGNHQSPGPPQMNGYYNGQSGYVGHSHGHPGAPYPPNRDGGQGNYGGPPSHPSQVNHPVLPFPPYSSHNRFAPPPPPLAYHPAPPHPHHSSHPPPPYGQHGNLYNYDNFNSPYNEGKSDRSIVSLPESSTYGRINSLSFDQAFEEFQRALVKRSSSRSSNRDRNNSTGHSVRMSESSVRSSSRSINIENSGRHTIDTFDSTSRRSGHSSKKSKKKKRSRSRSRSRDKSVKKSKKDKDKDKERDRHRDKDEKKEKKKDDVKERDREKDKDKDKERDRDRDRDREREREREKIKIKDKDDSRIKDRDTDRERKKDSDKERNREKDKDKVKDKDRDKERERKLKKV